MLVCDLLDLRNTFKHRFLVSSIKKLCDVSIYLKHSKTLKIACVSYGNSLQMFQVSCKPGAFWIVIHTTPGSKVWAVKDI